MKKKESKTSNQIVANTGLYYICYRLSKLGWNVMPTSRNAKGVDIVVYNQDASIKRTIQVKALSKKTPVPLGNPDNLFADYVIICVKIFEEKPDVFIAKSHEISIKYSIRKLDKKKSFWIQPTDYEKFRDKWNKIK